jgi:hypothetical protein
MRSKLLMHALIIDAQSCFKWNEQPLNCFCELNFDLSTVNPENMHASRIFVNILLPLLTVAYPQEVEQHTVSIEEQQRFIKHGWCCKEIQDVRGIGCEYSSMSSFQLKSLQFTLITVH